ncbi:MAG: PorT family protein [Flavobacteriales bacterium]|nr:PorT family protein [Flavobacteriales bacterium]
MKKIAALLSFIFVISITAKAQTDFQLGLNFSPNISWFKAKTDNVTNEKTSLGFNFGIIGDFNIADNYAFSTGLNIVTIGGEISYPFVQEVDQIGSLSGRKTADITLKYVEIPLTLKLKTNEIGYLTYYGQFGFGLGVNYDAKADVSFAYPSTTGGSVSAKDVDYKDDINLLRASLIVGLGAEYNLSGNTSFIMGITFNNGFTNVLSEEGYADDNNDGLGDVDASGKGSRNKDFKAINNYILLNLGIIF